MLRTWLTRARAHIRDQRGETLVEVVLTIAIAGIAVTALLAGLGTSINLSRIHRGQANADVVLVSAADSVKNQTYVPCPTVTTSSYNPTSGLTLPTGWSSSDVTITQVLGWNGSAFVACAATDAKLQLVTIRATTPGSESSEIVSVVKRSDA